MDSFYLVDEFVNVSPGEPFRLFPFGKLVKGGVEKNITPEFASRFKLPHFKPPIKLGSHGETTPAGGHIKSLVVKEDGLYAVPEFTDKGAQVLADGDYRYHSPEVIWEGKGLENPDNGEIIEGPLIVGDALLHTPHLGEATALYQIEPPISKGENQMSDYVEVPKSLWEQITSLFTVKSEPVQMHPVEPQEDIVKPDEFQALEKERDDYKAKLAAIEAEKEHAELLSSIKAEFDTEEYGMSYVELGKAEEAAGMLAKMDEDVRVWVLGTFKALSKQIDEGAILSEKGSIGEGEGSEEPKVMLHSVVQAKADELGVSYIEALDKVKSEQPDLVDAAYSKESK